MPIYTYVPRSIRNTRLLTNLTYITGKIKTWWKTQLIHTLNVAPLQLSTRHHALNFLKYKCKQHTHTFTRHTHTHTHTRTQHNALFPICYVNENKSISNPPPTIHKPIERLLHIHVMHIINFKIRNSYNAKTNAFVKYKKTTITTNSPLCADNPVPMTERCHRY